MRCLWHHSQRVFRSAARLVSGQPMRGLPVVFGYSEFMDLPDQIAGIASFGSDLLDLYRRAAGYTASILRGAIPAELAIQRPEKGDLVINLATPGDCVSRSLRTSLDAPIVLFSEFLKRIQNRARSELDQSLQIVAHRIIAPCPHLLKATAGRQTVACREVPRVDGSELARRIFHVALLVGAAMCCRLFGAVHMTAGHNALRGSGPGQRPAFDNAMAHVGCPDRRIDRLCIMCSFALPTFTSCRISSAISSRR